MLPTVEETRGYDFQDPENAEKWRGIFVNPLRKVLEQVHPTLNAEDSALQYVESLCLRLLATLCAPPSPLTVQDVEERVARTFPCPLDKWALADARDAAPARRKRTPLPLDKVHLLLQKEVLLYKIDMSVSIFITSILEYVCLDILKLAGNFVKKISQKSGYETITCRDIKTAMCADKVLMDMFYQEWEAEEEGGGGGGGGSGGAGERRARRGSLSYAELVRDLLADEKSFLRDLNLIIRVFKEELEKILHSEPKTISLIFGNIVDIYELTVTLLGNLEDAMEMSQDSPTPYIGSCFEELAEVEEFRAYVRYARTATGAEARAALQRVADAPALAERLLSAGHGFRLAVKYYLPSLLLAPVAHVFLYHHYVLALLQIAPASDDRESFKQVECNLHPIKKLLIKALGNGPKIDTSVVTAARLRRQLAVEKCNELARVVDNWDPRDVAHCCNEFIREDTLSKVGPGKRIAERRAYLFDGLLLLCKPVTSLLVVNNNSGSTFPGGTQQLKLKEKLHIRKLELIDRPDTEEARHCVELAPRVGPAVVVACGSCAEKRSWMCDLVMLNTKPMLDRTLDSILLELERRHPLQLPPPHLYRFAEPDAPANLVLEPLAPHHAVPLIKGATLLKLVERLTYHIYADLNLVRTFLTTYRSFCTPPELLDLLVERFRIPDAADVCDAPRHVPRIKIPKKDLSPNSCVLDLDTADSIESVASTDAEKLSKNTAREDWKRYRKEFQQPVKFRVINVLRHWVDQHFYDFERDPALLERLRTFLESVDGKPMRKWVQSVLKTLQRKSACGEAAEGGGGGGMAHVFDRAPPAVLRHVADAERCRWHPLALHPLELARQLTLLEFQLYRQVKPSELVGAVWTKKDKEKTSPNLLKIIKHTTNFTRWMEKWIVESENLEERAGVVSRLLELGAALQDLNNFNGVLAVVAALGSAAVHRLKGTMQAVPPRLVRTLEHLRDLNSDHFRLYQERLRSINPPCVPFFGIYLTNILHIEEGNLDYLPNSELINFSKRRKVAEITGEIQQYQNQPYCLTVEPKTRQFLESLDPFPGMDDNEITNYLYAKSLEIEPRPPLKQMPKFARKFPELSLKPVKASRRALADHHADDAVSVSQLSPPGAAWGAAGDAASPASLPHHDERGARGEEKCLVSPRLERGAAQLSFLDKGLALFDKNKPAAAVRNARDEPPSPRERHSPRHDRAGAAGGGGAGGKKGALSPRGAIVDADGAACWRSADTAQERVPPLLPRNSTSNCVSTTAAPHKQQQQQPPPTPEAEEEGDKPPALPKRSNSPPPPPRHCADTPPDPPDRPPPSPAHELFRHAAACQAKFKAGLASPGASPAPPSPAPLAFHFPPAPSPSPREFAAPGAALPPPLPPRRRRDSAAPPTPHTVGGCGSAGGGGGAGAPPPLPPRPAAAPALLRPAHSAILQRRQHSNNSESAPRLPPKPPPVSPRP